MKLQPEFWLGQTVKVIRPDNDDDYYDYYVDYGSNGHIGRDYIIKGITYNHYDDDGEVSPYYSYVLEGSNLHRAQVLVLVDPSTTYTRVPFLRPIGVRNQRTLMTIISCYVGFMGTDMFCSKNHTTSFNNLILNTEPII